MTTALTFANATLPVANLGAALAAVPSMSAGGDVILKMDKTGSWVFGADATVVEDDSTWAINPYSFVHGFVAWGEGEKLGEKMAPMTGPLPESGDSPSGAKRGWEPQAGFSLRCMSGEDEGLEVRYAVSSVGGRKAVSVMVSEVAKKAQAEATAAAPAIVPIVKLGDDHYQHKQYGKIFTPVFEILEWVPLTGKAEAAPAAPAVEETGRRRRRAAA